MKLRKALNIPDCHIPWEDKKSYEIMLLIAQDVDKKYGLEEINIMGDYADFHALGLHPTLPRAMNIKEGIKDEIYAVHQRLNELRTLFPKARINYIEGNHEWRLLRYIVKKCPELFDLYTLPEVLQFDKYGINYYEYGKTQFYRCLGTTDLGLRHQPYNGGKHCAASSAHSKAVSLAFGHTHRKQSYTFRDALGKEISCYSLGWLGDKSAPPFDYMDHDNWGQAIQIVTAIGNEWWEDTIDIKNHKAIYEGYLYEA